MLAAREAMRQLVDDLLGRSILAPGAFMVLAYLMAIFKKLTAKTK